MVYAGTLEPYQGIDILIKAFRLAADVHEDLFLLIVGGSRKQVDDYTGLADALGLNGRVHFTGTVPQATAKYYSSLASVLVSPRSRGPTHR